MPSLLHDPSVMIIFSYALTGLGHLRVTDALYRGLPEGVRPLTLYSQDTSAVFSDGGLWNHLNIDTGPVHPTITPILAEPHADNATDKPASVLTTQQAFTNQQRVLQSLQDTIMTHKVFS